MVTKELIEYIKAQTAKGVSRDAVLNILVANGWEVPDVNQAFGEIAKTNNPTPNSSPQQNFQPAQVNPSQSSYQPSQQVEAVQPKTETVAQSVQGNFAIQNSQPQQNQSQQNQNIQIPKEEEKITQIHSMITPNMGASAVNPSSLPLSASQASSVAQMQPQAQNIQPSQIIEKKKHKFWPIILIIIFLLIGGGLAYAYFTGMFLSMEQISKRAFDSYRDAKSSSFDTTISIESVNNNTTSSTLSALGGISKSSVTLKGDIDIYSTNNPKFDTQVSFSLGNFGISSFNLKYLDNKIYGQLVEFPQMLSFFGDMEKYKNNWYSFDIKSDENKISDLPINPFVGFNPDQLSSLSDSAKAQIEELTRDASFVTIVEKLPSEEISGAKTHHASFDLNKAGIEKYLSEVISFVRQEGKSDSQLSSFDLSSINETLSKINNFAGEIWIGEKDSLIYKISMSFNFNESDTSSYKVNFVTIFKEWNQPKMITAPVQSISIEELMNQAKEEGKIERETAVRRSNLYQMQITAKTYYDEHKNSYAGFCKMLDDVKVAKGTNFVCKDSKTSFAISEQLPDNTFWCIDSKDFSGTVAKTISTTACPK